MERQLLRFLNDQRFRWVSSLILLLGFFIGSLQDVNYEFSIEVLEGMFPAFLYACIFLIPVYRRRKLYKLIYNRAVNDTLRMYKNDDIRMYNFNCITDTIVEVITTCNTYTLLTVHLL